MYATEVAKRRVSEQAGLDRDRQGNTKKCLTRRSVDTLG